MTVQTSCGREIDYESAVNLMDDDIREELHREITPCTEQEFYDSYCKRHFKKFGVEFEPENGAW